MLSVNKISFFLGARTLYEEASLHVTPKSRIGLVGANGTGKSTLLRLIARQLKPDEGSIAVVKDCTIGFLHQDLLSYETDESILSVAMEAFEETNNIQTEIDKVLHTMEHAFEDALVDKLADLQQRFEALGGYGLQSRAEAILEGLGFGTEKLSRPLREFSGGWRMRVILAKMLLQKPSLLMLDEPTNHLDLPSLRWLEEYLRGYEGAFILVSHDRYFLDNTVTTIAEISGQKIHVYPGSYTNYLEEKELRNTIQQGAYENQQQKIKQTERFIERFKAKASKARQVQSRVKMLERMDAIEEVTLDTSRVNIRFTTGRQPGREIMRFRNLSKTYGDLSVLNDTDAVIERGDKIALIGANGRGKSTLLRIIADSESFVGERLLGYNVSMSFYAQHQSEALHLGSTILEELGAAGSDRTEAELRSLLGCFLFSGDDVFKKIKVLSGGEKSRVALAKILVSEANFLLLDEPTNHLDIRSVDVLAQALHRYEGSFVIVSHDRHFISRTANKIWYIEEGKIKEYPGTYDEYEVWHLEREKKFSEEQKSIPPTKNAPVEKKQNSPDTEYSKKLKSIKKEIDAVEQKITESDKLKEMLEIKLADPAIYGNPQQLHIVHEEYTEVLKNLEILHSRWENLISEQEGVKGK